MATIYNRGNIKMKQKYLVDGHKKLKRDGELQELVVQNTPNNFVTLRYKIKNGVLQFRFLFNGKATYSTRGVRVTSPVVHLDTTKDIHAVNEIIYGITKEKITDSVENCPQRYEELNELQFSQLATRVHQIFETEQTTHHRVYSITLKDRGIGKVMERFS